MAAAGLQRALLAVAGAAALWNVSVRWGHPEDAVALVVGRRRCRPAPGRVDRRHADEVALMCYTDRPERSTLFDDLRHRLEEDGTIILDAFLVRAGTAYPVGRRYDPADPDGTENAGFGLPDEDDPQVSAMAAATAWSGRGILPDRGALRESIAGPTGAAAARASAALRAAADGLLGQSPGTEPVDGHRLAGMAGVAADRALVEVAGHHGLTTPTSALLAVLMCDVRIREQMIGRAVREPTSPWLPMLIAVARELPDSDAAHVCAALSVVAYRHGDGALAQVAVDRCLAEDPEHRLAHLMLDVMAAGLPPADLADLGGQ